MRILTPLALLGALTAAACLQASALPETRTASSSDQHFANLARSWDEAVPLGNAEIGALVWQRGDRLRFSLDRTDLWELRPGAINEQTMKDGFARVRRACEPGGNYRKIQELYDLPYDRSAIPSKIPGAALEFALASAGPANSVHLYLREALAEVRWARGARMVSFVHATEPVGWFEIEGLTGDVLPDIIAPVYRGKGRDGDVIALSLTRLGYEQGTVTRDGNSLLFRQNGEPGFFYEVSVRWERSGSTLTGVWSISSSRAGRSAADLTAAAMKRGIAADYRTHRAWWETFHSASEISLPDPVLQKQYDNEVYKMGSLSRENSMPISLQAVWTADNGQLPPWKGDYHHDLNTQLSYWPFYTGNHLTEGLAYLNTLWKQRETFKRYTKNYFGKPGMAVPGVCTLTGEPMGGWCQYAMSPTIGAWVGQHFWFHWKYSADSAFLKDRAYPFMKDVCVFLEAISVKDKDGFRTLPLSSSPEIFDNTRRAWLPSVSNYDLGLMKFAFGAASEMAAALKLGDESAHWAKLSAELPPFPTDPDGGLSVCRDMPIGLSHRHFSWAMPIHPLNLIDVSQGEDARRTILATLERMEKIGPAYWCGYSYSWMGCLWARARNGEKAASYLRDFANCFCLRNTFHANGDQTRSGKSEFHYRPVTLEGNFAFASAVQEMLLQSHTGLIRVFPAVPKDWKQASFRDLRAMGAFLVSAELKNGDVSRIGIVSERGGTCRLELPPAFRNGGLKVSGSPSGFSLKGPVLTLTLKPGERVTCTAKTQK